MAYKRRRQTHSSFLLGDPCLKKKNKQTQKFFSFNFCDLIGENQCVYIPFIFSVPRRGVNNAVHGHVFLRLLEDLYFYRTRKTWRWDMEGRFDTTTFLVWGLSREDLSDPTTRSEVCSRRWDSRLSLRTKVSTPPTSKDRVHSSLVFPFLSVLLSDRGSPTSSFVGCGTKIGILCSRISWHSPIYTQRLDDINTIKQFVAIFYLCLLKKVSKLHEKKRIPFLPYLKQVTGIYISLLLFIGKNQLI